MKLDYGILKSGCSIHMQCLSMTGQMEATRKKRSNLKCNIRQCSFLASKNYNVRSHLVSVAMKTRPDRLVLFKTTCLSSVSKEDQLICRWCATGKHYDLSRVVLSTYSFPITLRGVGAENICQKGLANIAGIISNSDLIVKP